MPFGVALRLALFLGALSVHALAAVGLHSRGSEHEAEDSEALLQVPIREGGNHTEALSLRPEEGQPGPDAMPPVFMKDSFLRVTNHMLLFEHVAVSMRVAAASTAAAIFTTVNDLPWFLPFALHSDRWRFVGVYMLAKEVVVLAAVFLVRETAMLAATLPGFPIQRFLFVLASFFMGTYALILYLEDKRVTSAPVEDGIQRQNAKDAPPLKEQLLTASKVAIISTLGNVDSLGIFVPGLQQGLFSLASLLVSTAVISCLVGALCIGFGQLVHVGAVVDLVPLWFILLLLATWSAIDAFLF